MVELEELILIGFIFELSLIITVIFFLILVYRKYQVKKNKLTLILFFIFLSFLFAMFFSWLVKYFRLFSDIAYLIDDTVSDPGTLESWFTLRIIAFRYTFIFVVIALFFSYILKVKLFDQEYNNIERFIVYGLGVIDILLNLFLYEKGNILYDLVVFLLTTVLIIFVYIPFMLKTLKAYKNVEEPIFKRGFLSLSIMALSFVMILIFQFLDRITMFLGGQGYSVFYFSGWISALIGIISAYFGYINPKAR